MSLKQKCTNYMRAITEISENVPKIFTEVKKNLCFGKNLSLEGPDWTWLLGSKDITLK